MRKFLSICAFFVFSQFFAQLSSTFKQLANETIYNENKQLVYVSFKEAVQVRQSETTEFLNLLLFSNSNNKLVLLKNEQDAFGYSHLRFGIESNGIQLSNKMLIAHCKNGKLVSVNGDLTITESISSQFSLSESQALNFALTKIDAKKYKWENKAEESHMRMHLNQPNFTYYPKGEKTLLEVNGKLLSAYKFNIYAEEPLYRAMVYVDAVSGKILEETNLICTADVPGTAITKYSGTQTITCDQNSNIYRLREVQRGLGIETFDMNNTTTYSATDFTSTSTSWTTTGVDQAATDAHWGAEVTYDYFLNEHNRNSIDGNGFKLLSYVHYSNNYNNAFWDGQRMTYGDGNGTTFTILTALDVCGHEVTHGLTSNSSALIYSNQSGALNESYSDIFGTLIENYGRPSNWNWKIGTDMTPSNNGIRDMQNPKLFNHPNTYLGQYYYTGTNDNGGVHTNSGVSNYWFYLLSAGGTGTNDISNPYTVTGLGMVDAAKIAFRALTVYYTPSTNFANARLLSIQAAKDLFGNCSNEVIQTTNAWHAVGVGAVYSPSAIDPDFDAATTNVCVLPANVSFNNTTASGVTYLWDFGDNSTSTATNVVHTYTANGTYNVKLKVVGCQSLQDSITKNAYIVINAPATPSTTGASVCASGSLVLNATGGSNLKWYDSPALTNLISTGNTYNTPNLTSSTTYYVINTVSNTPAFGGMLTNTGGGFLNNATHYIIFDVSQNATLESVVAYAQTAGNRTIQLRNSANVVLTSTVINLAAGANTLALNFNLVPGTNYRLGLSGASDMYRSNSTVSYPYAIAGCVNLVNSSAGTGFYYWFYNWKVKKADCVSAAAPVTAVINPLPVLNISVASTVVCRTAGEFITLTGSPAGGTFSGTGVSGNTFDSSVGVGTYTVTYNYTDGNGCSNSKNIELNVSECTGIASNAFNVNAISVYPNPLKGSVYIKNANFSNTSKVVVLDALGRVVTEKDITSGNEKINLSDVSNGMYFLSIKEGDKTIKVIKLIKE